MTAAKLRHAQAAMGQPGIKVGELCAELGVTRQTVYRYYPSLADLLGAVAQAGLEDFVARMQAHLATATMPDANGVARRSLDIAGNGRFVRNLVERAEEEREYRLDHSDSEDFTDDELMTITDTDVNNSAIPLLRGLGLEVPA